MYNLIIAVIFFAVIPAFALETSAEPTTTESTAISLAHAVQRTLANNPALHAATLGLGVYAGNATQAARPHNPTLSLSADEILGSDRLSGFDAAEISLKLEQKIEMGGKRRNALALADHELDAAKTGLLIQRTRLLAALTQQYVQARAGQELAALQKKLVTLAADNVSTVTRRLQAGAANEAELAKARIAEAEARLHRFRAVRDAETQRHQLAGFWGSTAPDFDRLNGPFFEYQAAPNLEFLSRMLEHAPYLRAARLGVDGAEARRALAESHRIPDMTIGAGVQYFKAGGDRGLLAGLSFPLPVFDRNQGMRAAAAASVQMSQAELQAIRTDLATQLVELQRRLTTHVDALQRLHRTMLPQARQAFNVSQQLYARGRFSYLDLLDAQRTLFAQEKEQIKTLAAYHATIAEIEGLLGTAIGELPTSDQPKDDSK